MNQDIIHECIYSLILIILILAGTLLCARINNEIVWKEKYNNWEYNIDCDCGNGFF